MSNQAMHWRKSSYSGGEGGQCVQLAALDSLIGIRDSKNPHHGHLAVRREALAALIEQIKADELNV